MGKFPLIVIGASLAAFLVTGGHTVLPVAAKYIKPSVSPSCRIKGNVSINTGERIYHVPGQIYYEETRISPNMVSDGFVRKRMLAPPAGDALERRACGLPRARSVAGLETQPDHMVKEFRVDQHIEADRNFFLLA
ncbi:hypothetical protein SAMN03159496_05441 [Rhizobium sp. NFR07]|nr:hypothetical protein SAMN03159496_05441 [Rhizobium sp. NFR07]